MEKDLLERINHYGVNNQLRKFNEECYELIEAIIDYKYVEVYKGSPAEKYHKQHIVEELADNFVMLYQFPYYYYELLDDINVEPYIFTTDNYNHIDDIQQYLKDFQKDIFKLTKAILHAEEREQDYISIYTYDLVIEALDTVLYKLVSIKEYYHITDNQIKEVMRFKIERQKERMKNGK